MGNYKHRGITFFTRDILRSVLFCFRVYSCIKWFFQLQHTPQLNQSVLTSYQRQTSFPTMQTEVGSM